MEEKLGFVNQKMEKEELEELWDHYRRPIGISADSSADGSRSARGKRWGGFPGVTVPPDGTSGCPFLAPSSPVGRKAKTPDTSRNSISEPLVDLSLVGAEGTECGHTPEEHAIVQSGGHGHAVQGVLGSVWNLLNDVIGAPIVLIPYYVAICGWSLGFTLLVAYSVIRCSTEGIRTPRALFGLRRPG